MEIEVIETVNVISVIAPLNVGQAFVDRYGHRFKRRADESRAAGICCFASCRNEHAGIYMGFPFCDHHWRWVDRKIESLWDEHEKAASQ